MYELVLQYHETVTVNQASCYEKFLPLARDEYPVWLDMRKNLIDGGICALTKKGEGICYGDSGGPLVTRTPHGFEILIGVASWGLDCGNGYPDVFTNVFQHLDFIHGQLW